MKPIDLSLFQWPSMTGLPNRSFVCGFCGVHVSSTSGLQLATHQGQWAGGVYICPNCRGPNFIVVPGDLHYLAAALGKSVEYVPDDLNSLYEEARTCTSDGCYTAAVLLCRKMLMNVAVHLGAKEGKPFIEYVKYLSDAGYVPPNGKHWVDHIRDKGNEANHEIALMGESEAQTLLVFVEMLLRFIYEFPNLVPQP